MQGERSKETLVFDPYVEIVVKCTSITRAYPPNCFTESALLGRFRNACLLGYVGTHITELG